LLQRSLRRKRFVDQFRDYEATLTVQGVFEWFSWAHQAK
jgi:hypothetical protein